ncbi:hypothetical protein [[Enterobacter] lignolyticus]|uniref:hypothetical protein n=1 Tax=[Enterobacter] lignolyticus TaxID=1334193 RepID=UPI0012FEEB1F|nr:hypothetical protein [[Enterobacter] lignolyticus]
MANTASRAQANPFSAAWNEKFRAKMGKLRAMLRPFLIFCGYLIDSAVVKLRKFFIS